MNNKVLHRRQLTRLLAAGAAVWPLASTTQAHATVPFQLNYLLGSCMYGYLYLGEILPEVRRTGATAIDIWPKIHGNQREQMDDLGEEKFAQMLEQHQVTLGCITQYKLGPFGLQDEMRVAQRMNCRTIVTSSIGPVGLTGAELKRAVGKFIEQMKPHLEVAAKTGVTIAIENHSNHLIASPDSLKWLVELAPSAQLGIAFAPYHLPQDAELLGSLLSQLGNSVKVFYAWQHGMGCMEKLPKEQELLQLPGRGTLDFAPLVKALVDMNYQGWTEIFMHPVPRGIPIRETVGEVSDEINAARSYIEALLPS